MASRLALLAVAAAFIAYSPMVALGCSGSSAQLSDGTKVAQGYGSSPTQSMPDQNASQGTDQGGSSAPSSDSSQDKN